MLRGIDISKPRYDQDTYVGRVRHFINVVDPRGLLTSQEEVSRAKDLIAQYQAGTLEASREEDLWAAKKVLATCVHPDTGEMIPMPFRISAFAPMNILICWGLLLPNPSMATVAFWQWVNQSYNVAVNHANRNASNTMSTQQILTAYGGAVTVSVGVALGMREFVKRAQSFSPTTRAIITAVIPFAAVGSAGAANIFLMRYNEIKEGITVVDKNGEPRGVSPKAGLMAVSQVAAVRVATAFPVLLLPPMIMNVLETTAYLKASPKLVPKVHLAVITTTLFSALPLTIALFPQTVAVPASSLEAKFHDLKCDGKPIDRLYFNRGL